MLTDSLGPASVTIIPHNPAMGPEAAHSWNSSLLREVQAQGGLGFLEQSWEWQGVSPHAISINKDGEGNSTAHLAFLLTADGVCPLPRVTWNS